MKITTLIHTALPAEAKPIVGTFGLTCKSTTPFLLYANTRTVLVVSGIGRQQTRLALAYALAHYTPQVMVSVGIAGCAQASIPLGTLFCTSDSTLSVPYATLSTHDTPLGSGDTPETTLVDMEADAFLQSVPCGVEAYVFKVVSDHLCPVPPTKAQVGGWIGKSIGQWRMYARL